MKFKVVTLQFSMQEKPCLVTNYIPYKRSHFRLCTAF